MAILNKRRSTSQLPQLQQRSIYEPFVNLEAGERGREILRPSGVRDRGDLSTGRPVTSVVRGDGSSFAGDNLGGQSSIGGGRLPSLGGITSRPITSTTSGELAPRTSLGGPRAGVLGKPAATAPKPSIPSKTTAAKPALTARKPAVTTAKPAVSTKPTLTSKTTAAKPATKTSVTPTTKPTVTKSTGTTSKLGTALTGAALGAATKAVIDKITGTPKKPVVKPPISSVVTPPGTPKPPVVKPPVSPVSPVVKPPVTPKPPIVKPPVIPGTPKPPIVKPPVLKPPVVPPTGKPPITSVVKPPVGGGKPPIGGGKPPVVPKGSTAGVTAALTDEQIQAELDRVKADEEAFVAPEGAVTNADGSYSVTEDGMVTTYDKDGNIIGMESVDEAVVGEGADTVVSEEGEDTIVAGEGEDTVVAGDGINTTSGLTRSLTGTGDTTLATSTDTSAMTDLGEGYFQDDSGNIYGADGSLIYTLGADGEYIDANAIDTSTAIVDDTTYTDPETGDVYNLGADGNWTLEGGDSVTEDITTYTDPDTGLTWNMGEDGEWTQEGYESSAEEDVTTYTDPDTGFTWNLGDDGEWTQEGFDDIGYDDTSYDETDYSLDNTDYSFDDTDYSFDDYEGKRGGLVAALMRRGGKVRHFEDGGYSDTNEEVQDFQNVNYNFGEFDDPTMSEYTLTDNRNPVGNTYLRSALAADDNEGIEYPYNTNRLDSIANNEPSEWYDNDDGTFSRWEGDQYVTVDGETSTELLRVDSDGNPVTVGEEVQDWQNVNESGTVGDANYYTDELGNTIYTDNDGNMTFYDPEGRITSTGSTGGQRYRTEPTEQPTGGLPDNSGIFDTIKDSLGTYAGSAAAGALLASLLESADSGGGGGGNSSGIDMSQVGVLNPRTTDFGIGPARYVGYDEYGAQDEMPEMYGNELYQNLNAPGFNPINEGDYADPKEDVLLGDDSSYADEADYGEETESVNSPVEETTEMADGGMAHQTHYTFGKSVDPLVNLGLKNGQPMKSGGLSHGGLPAFSNVPITQGRLNFRQGAAVHGPGDGQSDDIPAMLADGEYVIDADTVAQIGNGSTKAGAAALDKFRENIRSHKRSAPINKIPPKTKALTSYLKGAR